MKLPSRKEIQDRQKTESPIEDIVLREFHLLGYYPTPQYWIDNYRVDLAFVEHKLAIECDGKEWHEGREVADLERDEFLKSLGWQVLRISGHDIYKHADEIIKALLGIEEMQDRSEKIKNDPIIEIDYENDPLDIIEEKEERLRNFDFPETSETPMKKTEKISDIIKRRYDKNF